MVRALARLAVVMGASLLLAACGSGDKSDDRGGEPRASASGAGAPVAGPERRVLALGDSLFAGYGLASGQAYPVRLEAALRAKGSNVRVSNAGVSGDTTADGLARLQFTLSSQQRPPDLVLLCLGGNDMLRGLPVAQTRANLDAILTTLERRHVPVVLMGMLAPPNMGPEYARDFDAIYPQLAKRHHVALVPFFLQAVIGRDDLRLADHLHPTPAGVEAIVAATTGAVTGALARGGAAGGI